MELDHEYDERRRADDAEKMLTHERIRSIERMATATSAALAEHVSACARIQKWGLVVGSGTLMWLVGHSAEAERIVGKIIKIVVQ